MGKERTMKLRTLIKNVKENEEKAGIGNRLVYSIIDQNNSCKSCKIVVADCSNLKLGLSLKPILEHQKKKEELKIESKTKLDTNLIIIDNGESIFPIITLYLSDICDQNINYFIIDAENKELIKGRMLIPWIYDKDKEELFIWQNGIVIKREDILIDIQISKGRNLLELRDGKKIVTIR